MATGKKIHIPKSLTEGQYETKEQLLSVAEKRSEMFVGIPREMSEHENRVALVPSSVTPLTAAGIRVIVETNAGEKSNFTDHDYSEAGAEIGYSQKQVYESNVILKVSPPTLEEIDLMHPNQILITPLQLPTITEEYLFRLREKRVIAIALEYLQDAKGSFPVVRVMSEIAGLSAILTAAELLATTGGGKGVLLGGISGVPPAKVVILGAGVVAEYATRTALGLGAEVRIFDNNIYKLMRIQNQVGRQISTSVITPRYLERELKMADVVIGAIHSESGRTPMIVTEAMVMKMKQGSVIIDVSIDQGGCFETSELTTLANPTIEKHGVIHYCVPNIASRVARTASVSVSNILMPLLIRGAEFGGLENLLNTSIGVRHGVYMYKGKLTNAYLSERFGMKYTDLELMITSRL